jgi:hypothetical protein
MSMDPTPPQPAPEAAPASNGKYYCDLCNRPFPSPRGLAHHRGYCARALKAAQAPVVPSLPDLKAQADALKVQAAEYRSRAAKMLDYARKLEEAANALSA